MMVRPVCNGGYKVTSPPIRPPPDQGPGEPEDPRDHRLPGTGVRGGDPPDRGPGEPEDPGAPPGSRTGVRGGTGGKGAWDEVGSLPAVG